MMVVTGATGNIGRELVRQLHTEGRGSGVRALTRDAARGGAVLPAGVDLAEGDLGRADSLKSALDGARSLFLIAGVGDDAGILDVARDAGVEHVVLVSSITTVTHPHLGHAGESRRRAPPAGERDGVDRAAAHAVRLQHPLVGGGRTRGVRGPRSVPGRRAARRPPRRHRLGGPRGADGAGPPGGGRTRSPGLAPITPREQIAELERLLGRKVACVGITREDAYGPMAAMMGAEVANSVLDLMGGDVNDALLAVHDTVARVTGSPARPYRRWAEENADAFR